MKNTSTTPAEMKTDNKISVTKQTWKKPSLLVLDLSQTNGEKIPGGVDGGARGNWKS